METQSPHTPLTDKKTTIMAVDDLPQDLRLLETILRRGGYRVVAFPEGNSAFRAALRNPPALFLLDIRMPGMDGYELCRKIKGSPPLRNIPVLFLSSLHESREKVKAFSAGGADFITKPFQQEEVLARVASHLKLYSAHQQLRRHSLFLEERVEQQTKEILEAQLSTIMALVQLTEERDGDTGEHIERIGEYCTLLARELRQHSRYGSGISEEFIQNIRYASALHDIGKVGIRDCILQKPGSLSEEEFEQMKEHAAIGARTLRTVQALYPKNSFINMGIEIALRHHERWDGTGYPQGLRGEAIPLSARIMAVADVYDALRMKRCYKNAFSHEKSLSILSEGRGTQFDPVVLDAFLQHQEEFRRIFAQSRRRNRTF